MAGPKESRQPLSNAKDRIQLSEVLYVLKEKRKYVIFVTVLTLIGSIISHLLFIPGYSAPTRLEVLSKRDNVFSRLGMGEMGMGGYYDESQEVARHLSRLKAGSFYIMVAEALVKLPEFSTLDFTQPSDLSIFRSKFWSIRFRNRFSTEPVVDEKISITPPAKVTRENIEFLASLLQEATTVTPEGSQWITLSVRSYDPRTAIFLANLEGQVYVKSVLNQELNDLNELHKFISIRLEESNAQLRKEEQELVEFKKQNRILGPNDSEKTASIRSSTIENQISTARLKIHENESLIRLYQKKLTENTSSILRGKAPDRVNQKDPRILSRQLDNLRRQKYLMVSEGLPESDSRVAEVNSAIRTIASQLRRLLQSGKMPDSDELPVSSALINGKISDLKNMNKELNTQLEALEESKAQFLKSASKIPKIEQELYSRSESLKLNYELYSSFKKKLQDIEIQKLTVKPSIRVDGLTLAAPREVRLSLIFRLPFAILVGIFLGVVLVMVIELTNTTVRHASELEEFDLTLLGNVPHVESKLGEFKHDEINPDLLVCESRPNSPEAMAYKYLREQLKVSLNSMGNPVRTITVSGTDKHEGKSLFASNLAVSLAKMDVRVLLLDCDIRAPAVHKYFGLTNDEGLSTLLTNKDSDYLEFLFRGRIKNLDVITAGPLKPNPTELVGSERFKTLLKTLNEHYDYIVLDAPPSVYVADAPVIAGVTDAVVLVARYRITKRSSLLLAHRKVFQISHRRCFGVLNDVPKTAHEFTPYVVTLNEFRKNK
ncbi:MAG: polysaccharide biosynthesis tyrosine autokinase [Bdellovibrio sp.]|nr:polysaccharide biosynthesis tyrosine autokinase [Bdellovibrio sp.]